MATLAGNRCQSLGPGKTRGSASGLEDLHHGPVDLVLLVQDDHVAGPTDVANLLLAQLDPGVEDAEVVLLLEGHLVHVHVLRVDQVLDGLRPRCRGRPRTFSLGIIELLHLVEKLQVLGVRGRVQRRADRRLVPDLPQLPGALGVQVAEVGVEGVAVLELLLRAQLRVQRVEGHEQHTEVRLHLEHVPHDLRGRAPDALDEAVEVLEPGLLQRGLHHLQVLLRQDAAHLRGLDAGGPALVGLLEVLLEVRADGRVHEEDAVDVVEAALHVEGLGHDDLHALEDAQGVHLLLQLHGRLVVQRALDDHADVVDHLLARDEVHEGREGLHGLGLEVAELVRELLVAPLRDRRNEQRRRLILQERPVVRLLQGAAQVLKGVAGAEATVVLHAEEAAAEAADDGLAEAVVDVEGRELHCQRLLWRPRTV
mmetsp:Transcript_79988/g.259120  ORF Transcript_79988/g.259120 Transcript_79988/m.259120 type:complete len:424 (+) Transcript_79988:60-1331(+)